MGAQVTYGTINVGAYYAHLRGTSQPAFMDQYDLKWDRGGGRGPRTWRDPNQWFWLWPSSRFAGGGDIGQGYIVTGQDLAQTGQFGPYLCDGPGQKTMKFIKGKVVDESGNPVPSATVQGFRTSDDAFCGFEASAREDGEFDLPTMFPNDAHYIVAYVPGSPDRGGTSLNTLTPAFIDGS